MWALPAAEAPPLLPLLAALALFAAAYRRLAGLGGPGNLGADGRMWGMLVGSTLPIFSLTLVSGNLAAAASYIMVLAAIFLGRRAW